MTCVICGDENRDYGTISDERSEEVVLESSPALGTIKYRNPTEAGLMVGS